MLFKQFLTLDKTTKTIQINLNLIQIQRPFIGIISSTSLSFFQLQTFIDAPSNLGLYIHPCENYFIVNLVGSDIQEKYLKFFIQFMKTICKTILIQKQSKLHEKLNSQTNNQIIRTFDSNEKILDTCDQLTKAQQLKNQLTANNDKMILRFLHSTQFYIENICNNFENLIDLKQILTQIQFMNQAKQQLLNTKSIQQKYLTNNIKILILLIKKGELQRQNKLFQNIFNNISNQSNLTKLKQLIFKNSNLSQNDPLEFKYKCIQIYLNRLSDQLNKLQQDYLIQKETKECLTNEIFQYIHINQRLKAENQKLQTTLQEQRQINKTVGEIGTEIVKYEQKMKNFKTYISRIELEKQQLQQQILNKISEAEESQNKFAEMLKNKESQIDILKIRFKFFQKDYEIAKQQLTKSHLHINNLKSEINDQTHQIKIYQSKIQSMEKYIGSVQQTIDQIKTNEIKKINLILELNMDKFKQNQQLLKKTQQTCVDLEKDNKKLLKQNELLKQNLIFYQKLYYRNVINVHNESYLEKQQKHLSWSSKRYFQFSNDMIILEQNSQNQETDRYENKQITFKDINQENQTMDENCNLKQNKINTSDINISNKKKVILNKDRSHSKRSFILADLS